MKTPLWEHLWREAAAILVVSSGITTALWIKRLIEQLTSRNVIDKTIVEHGLDRTVPVPISVPRAFTSPSSWGAQPSPSTSTTSFAQSGEVLVDGWDEVMRVPYTAMSRTRDGLTLYRHDTELNPYHECGPCPLLRARTPCADCEWYVNRDDEDVRCAALVKLQSSPQDFTTSVSDIKRQLEVW